MDENPLNQILGESAAIKAVLALVRRVASSDTPVLVEGETGTGKDLVATALHFNGPRRNHPFVAVNCGAIPESLIESELFGHMRGAFTGAISDHDGLFKRANRGTVFLDEVAELPLHLQGKLLRVLHDKSFTPIGGSKQITVDVRVISASNKDLRKLLEIGSFREDLYYRICAIKILLPPLRERGHDLILLANHFVKELTPNKELKLTREAIDKLRAYPFPGNVRELRHVIERACVLAEGPEITASEIDIPESNLAGLLREVKKIDFKHEIETIKRVLLRDAIVKHERVEDAARYLGLSPEEFKGLYRETLSPSLPEEATYNGLYDAVGEAIKETIRRGEYHTVIRSAEKALLEYLLKRYTKTAVAKMLRVSPMTLYRKLRAHGINRTGQ